MANQKPNQKTLPSLQRDILNSTLHDFFLKDRESGRTSCDPSLTMTGHPVVSVLFLKMVLEDACLCALFCGFHAKKTMVQSPFTRAVCVFTSLKRFWALCITWDNGQVNNKTVRFVKWNEHFNKVRSKVSCYKSCLK